MATTAVDPFTIEIIKNSLVAAGDEMFYALQRTSKSTIIYETLDYGVGITDQQGRLVAQGNGVPLFIGTLDAAVNAVRDKFGATLQRDDIIITNDPYGGGGTHLSDVSLVMPVYHNGELMAYVANKAHWTEVGGKDPGSWTTDSTEVFQEGLQFPNVKLFSRGEPDQSLLDLIAANVRLPDMTLGDLWAGVAALRVGERRFLGLCDKYGPTAVRTAIESLLDHGETMARQELARLPKGTFEAEDMIDDDGIGNGPFPVRVKVTISADEFVADFTGSNLQVPGPINNTRTGLVSGVRAVFKALTNPEIPANGGAFRPVRVVCPDGTVFTAQRPAPVSTYWETMLYATDLIWKALAPHIPERLPAGHFLSVCGTILAGQHPDSKELFLLVEPLVGGWGAGHDKDGDNGQFCVGDGETYNIPIEVTETRYGVLVDQYEFHTEDGGAGEFRGGKGVILDYRIVSDEAYLTGTFGRHRFKPWGMNGGQAGSNNYILVMRKEGSREQPVGKVARRRLERGDVARLVTGTGGGFGDPRRRPREKVLADVHDGYITSEQARRDYGIELT
ncbi:MAG: 5-oxoprolinase [Candidatus Nephthysia bennettiae]|uniref:Hydantoinase B/oxoprolinase family protein n=1 Tax=Candidatus Nephthysia bennettiae TaxID=3127016 RepID=A0A934NFJ6_9BACT|nr:hydantoinase B/oxoprolinase family protein [Candidatus Dormibacteraeota bacterium]PZR94058.1 MAG: 5-oxoprolinase [Candidatus Dormibacteraeota bacterium]